MEADKQKLSCDFHGLVDSIGFSKLNISQLQIIKISFDEAGNITFALTNLTTIATLTDAATSGYNENIMPSELTMQLIIFPTAVWNLIQ